MGQSRSSLRSHGSTSGASRNGFSTQVAASMLRNVFRSVYVGVQLDAVQVGRGSSIIRIPQGKDSPFHQVFMTHHPGFPVV